MTTSTGKCPFCPDGHRPPSRCSWGVRVGDDRDGDGQPTYLIVQPSNGAHVAQEDADWLWRLIHDSLARDAEPAVPPEVYAAAVVAYDEAVNRELGNAQGSALGALGRERLTNNRAFRASIEATWQAARRLIRIQQQKKIGPLTAEGSGGQPQ